MRHTNTKLCILGITGSIGQQTVALARKLGYKIVGCSFHQNIELGKKVVKDNHIPYFYCSSDNIGNVKDFDQLAKKAKPDLVVNAIVGFAGLKGTLAALHNKVNLALANKESVVVGGWYIFSYAKKHNLKIIPIDSEHSNLYYQLLQVNDHDINQIFITGSGGKYFAMAKKDKAKVTYEQAIAHKNWSMGKKITIDSNTLMNKCFEVIEAYWYFNTKKISVLLDKTSLIHSAIMLNNGEFVFSHSKPLMTSPIAWALTGFNYKLTKSEKADFATNILMKINNVKPIKWAYDVMNDKTHSLGIIMTAADEVAIKLFEQHMLRFDQIPDYIENAMKKIKPKTIKTIDDLYEFDKYCRLASIKYWK